MQTSIAQAAALTIHGNYLLQGHDPVPFWPGASVFTFCKHVQFFVTAGRLRHRETAAASDPEEWLRALRAESFVGLRLQCHPANDLFIGDRMSIGLVGGGPRWLVEAVRVPGADLWEPRWELGDREDPDQKGWEFGQKREPSGWVTVLAWRVIDRVGGGRWNT